MKKNVNLKGIIIVLVIGFFSISVIKQVIVLKRIKSDISTQAQELEELKEKNIKADFKNSYMFSDSLSDKPLLDLVGNPYLINYKKHHEIEILKWK